MKQIWEDNRSVYGARKLWHAMLREGHDLARCTVERLMRDIGIEGVRRGKKIKTTWSDNALLCLMDRVNRQFRATKPNQLWVSEFTYVSTWQGFVTLHSSSIPSQTRSSGGAHQGHSKRSLSWMLWNRHFMNDGPVTAWSITAIVAANMCQSNTLNGWQVLGWNPAWARSVTHMTMHWPRRWMASSRRRSFTKWGHGSPPMPLNGKPWNGSTGLTTAACSNPSDTSRQLKLRRRSMQTWTHSIKSRKKN